MEKWNQFIENWDFFREAALSGTFAGALLGALGTYILLGRMVFMSAALSQVSSAGVALGFWLLPLLGLHAHDSEFPMWCSMGLSLVIFAATAIPLRKSKTPDALLAVIYLCASSATLLICTQIVHEIQDVQQLLTGNAVLVEHEDYVMLAVMTPILLALFSYGHRAFESAMFRHEQSRVAGVPTNIIRIVIQMILVLVIAGTTQMMGALPVFALSCLPALAAKNAATFRQMFFLAMCIGAACGFGGYVLAFMADFPVGPSQTALAGMIAIISCGSAALLRFIRRLKHAA